MLLSTWHCQGNCKTPSALVSVVSCLDAFQTPVDNTVLFQGQHLHCLRHLRGGSMSRLKNIKLVVTHRPGGK